MYKISLVFWSMGELGILLDTLKIVKGVLYVCGANEVLSAHLAHNYQEAFQQC